MPSILSKIVLEFFDGQTMQKPRINKQKIFDAAKAIARLNKEPTVANIREYLAFTGSQTTLHKYLREWKIKCFKASEANHINELERKDFTRLQEENQTLKATIGKMEEHNKIVANEFAKTERKNTELTQNLAKVETQLNLLEKEHGELKKDKQDAETLCREVKEERDVLLDRMERDKDQLIASLREELRQTHQADLEKIQHVSYSGHEFLMQEKVKSMNLEEKVKDLTENLNSLQQELTNANRVVEPLRIQIKELQKLIADNLTSEQLQAYAKKQQLLSLQT